MGRFAAYCGLFILAMLVGSLVIIIAPMVGAPDYATFPGAVLLTLGVFVVCVRTYTPEPPPRARGGPRNLGIRLYNVGPSPTLEEVAAQLDEGARQRERGRSTRVRRRAQGRRRHHS